MTIIREGNKELAHIKRHKPVLFQCLVCGCQWTATKEEYADYSSQREGESFGCHCPTCGELIFSNQYFIK